MPPLPNKVPVIVIDISGNLYEGQPITIDCTQSTDPDGTIKQVIIQTGDGNKYESKRPFTIIHTYAMAGDYEVTVVMKDNKKDIGSKTVALGILKIGLFLNIENQQLQVDSSDGNPVAVTYPTAPIPTGGVQPYNPVQYSIPDGSSFPVGESDVTMTVSDAVGNTGAAILTITVIDTSTNPDNLVVVPPANISVDSDDNNPVSVAWPDATATGGTPPYVFTYKVGGLTVTSPNSFPLGITAVSCIVTDSLNVTDDDTFNVTVNANDPPIPPIPPTGSNAYYDFLITLPTMIANYSMRSHNQLLQYKRGSDLVYVDYTFPNDPDPRQQDAAKVTIPDYPAKGNLTLAMGIGDTSFTYAGSVRTGPHIYYKIDNEEMLYQSKVGSVVTVLRAQNGTVAAAHGVNATIGVGTNSLPSQVWFPQNATSPGNYLFTHDAWFGSECDTDLTHLVNWKTFQIRKGTSDTNAGICLEQRTRFDGAGSPLGPNDIARADVRVYTAIGPNATKTDPLAPQSGVFTIKKETWTRYWLYVELIDGDWDLLSWWVGDAAQGITKVYDQRQIDVTQPLISWQLEFNTSTDAIAAGRDPLVCYVRNEVTLKNQGNIESLLQTVGLS